MRRISLFSSIFALTIGIEVFAALLFAMVFYDPQTGSNTPFAGISINASPNTAIHLPNHIFTCTAEGPQSQCQTTIQERPLNLEFSLTSQAGLSSEYPSDSNGDLKTCKAQYDGQPTSCSIRGAAETEAYYEVAELGLSFEQLQAVRQKYWQINALKTSVKDDLRWLDAWMPIATGVSAACLAWILYPYSKIPMEVLRKSLAGIVWGLIFAVLVKVSFVVLLDWSGFIP